MEFKAYVRVLVRYWWVVLPVFLVTVIFTALFTLRQTPTYSATATFVVAPSSAFADARSFLSGLDVLGAKSQVANTYAEIATSDTVKQDAAEALGLPSTELELLVVASKLRAGTNVIEIDVEGREPVLTANFANEVGKSTITYVENLYEVYVLKALDDAKPAAAPVRPNLPLNLAFGVGLGFVLSVGLAFLFQYLRLPVVNTSKVGILDNESGAFSKHYFARRLKEEMSRARRHRYPLAVALMDIDPNRTLPESVPTGFQGDALRMVTTFFKRNLREEDVLSRMDESTFGFLLPDTSEEEAKVALEKLQIMLRKTSFEIEQCGVKLNLRATTGLVSYDFNGTGRNELLAKAYRALKQAHADGRGKVVASSKNGQQQALN